MPILVDATVLSNLAAVGRFDLLDILNDTVHVASAVYEETQQGLDEGYEFLTEVDQALDSGRLGLVTLESEREWRLYRAMPAKLQRGEAMSLAIAHSRGWRLLTDDRAARMYARSSDVPYSGTLGILRRRAEGPSEPERGKHPTGRDDRPQPLSVADRRSERTAIRAAAQKGHPTMQSRGAFLASNETENTCPPKPLGLF